MRMIRVAQQPPAGFAVLSELFSRCVFPVLTNHTLPWRVLCVRHLGTTLSLALAAAHSVVVTGAIDDDTHSHYRP